MKNIIENIQISPADRELFIFSHDFIKLNRDITNEQIPDSLLEFWSNPNSKADKDHAPSDVPLFIFIIITDLYTKSRKEGEEKLDINFGGYLYYQFFYTFQVILATTIHCRKYDIPIKPFQLFRIEKYHMPKIEDSQQLLLEYNKLTQANDSSCSKSSSRIKREVSSANQRLEISFPSQSNQLFLIETFVWEILSHFLLPYKFLGKINVAIVESINHAILCINESETKDSIQLIATKTKKQFKVTISYGTKSLSPKACKISYSEPIKDDDLKGRSLYLMKNLPDKISFLDDGSEVRLTFNI